MINQMLIRLIRKLRKYRIFPFKKKIDMLANLNDKQVELFLILKKSGFIRQDNLNYAIEMISKITRIGTLNQEVIRNLFCPNLESLNNELLEFILHELRADFDMGMRDIHMLSEIKYYLDISEYIDILKNKMLSDSGLLNSILTVVKESVFGYMDSIIIVESLNKVVSNFDILKSFTGKDNKLENRTNYYYMLNSFRKLLDYDDIERFESAFRMVSNVAKVNKLNPEKISKVLDSCIKIEKKYNFSDLESILLTTNIWEDADYIVSVLNHFSQTEDKDANLRHLTVQLYSSLMNQYHFSKEEANIFYHQLLMLLNSIPASADINMKNISEFILMLLSSHSDFMDYYQRNNEKVDFIKCALISESNYLENYGLICSKSNNIPIEIYDDIINSFDSKLSCYQLGQKSGIYASSIVLNAICEDPEVLKILNRVMDDPLFFASEWEINLFHNITFLKSSFFRDSYADLVNDSENLFREKSPDYQNNFFALLSTFDFNDPNLGFYMNNILRQFNDSEVINSLFIKRLVDRKSVELENTFGNLDFEVSTNTYQKRMGN